MKSDEFIREVDEELQQERLAALWKQYGAYAIGAALIIVAATAGQVGWTAWRDHSMQNQAAALDDAERKLAGRNFDDAAKAFAEIGSEYSGGPVAIARLREAMALHQSGDSDGAITALENLASDSGQDQIITDLAKLQSLWLQAEDGDPQTLMAGLAALATADRPWRHSARELNATIAIRAGDLEAARANSLRVLARMQPRRRVCEDALANFLVRSAAARLQPLLRMTRKVHDPTPSFKYCDRVLCTPVAWRLFGLVWRIRGATASRRTAIGDVIG